MKAMAVIVVLSIPLLSTAALAGDSVTQTERTHVSGLPLANDPVSRGPKTEVPGLMNYQGTLTDDAGVAIDTTVSMTFSIYTDSTGGSTIWNETQPSVVVSNGLFNVLLGSVNSIQDTVFKDPERWLGVQVGGDPELDPRQRIAAVGYAFRAAKADTAEFARAPAPSDGDWTLSGNHMYSAVPGSVGIGITNPEAKLHVLGGKITVSDAGDETGIKIAESWITDPYDGALHIQSGGGVVAFDGNDDVCIGTTTPSGKLTVDGGDAIIKGGDGWDGNGDEALLYLGDNNHGVKAVYGQGLRVWTFDDASSDIRFRGHTGTDYMTIKMNSGKVGIGTLSPGAMLDVSGDVNTDSLYKLDGSPVLSTLGYNTHVGIDAGANDTPSGSTHLGYNAGYNNSGVWCTSVGLRAGYSNEGTYNTFVGADAGVSHAWGSDNTFVGCRAGWVDTTGSNNTFIGSAAGYSNTSGRDNTLLGYYSGLANTTGEYNTFLGSKAGELNETGDANTCVGTNAGLSNTAGHNNTFLGTSAGYNTLGSNNVFLGYQAGFYETGSNKLYIANYSDTGNVLIYGDFSSGNVGIGTLSPAAKLDVQGTLRIQSNNSSYGGYIDNQSGGGDGLRTYANVSLGSNWGALYAINYGTSPAVYASGSTAGYFSGPVEVTGFLTKTGGGFKIDHPLEPANKYLYHSFVESPDMKNVYDGLVVLDASGEALVELPEWFDALNSDFRYQLTAIGAPGPDLFIAQEISRNQFKIAGGKPGMKVSWQVTGIRQDAYAQVHRLPVEVEKTGIEFGKYRHPKEHGMPESAGIDYEARRKKEMR